MLKLASVGILILGLSLAAVAADEMPKAEVFGGVSFLHIDTMGLNNQGLKANYAGWDSEFQYNINRVLGITADIGGNYGRLQPDVPNSHSYTYVFGPTFSVRRESAVIFAHTLFGQNSTNIISNALTHTSNNDSAFAMAFGGGLDIKLSQRFALRLGQLDWLYTRHNLSLVNVNGLQLKDHQNNIRYAGGITINLGGH
jgi:opacity protein-like surface antigen